MLKSDVAAFDALAPWMAEARRLDRDAAGTVSDPGIGPDRRLYRLIYHANALPGINLPWCGLFVAHCLAVAGIEDRVRYYARARPWRAFGAECAPQVGALMIFWHYARRSPFGHVAFYVAEDDTAFHVLGGNQLGRICVQRYPKARLLDCRWPKARPQTETRLTAPPEHARPFG